jgi:purine-binding chemotaxis protein CheW
MRPRAGVDGKYLTLDLGGDLYAMPIREVVRVAPFGSLRTIAEGPDHLLGSTATPSGDIPVVDMAAKLGLPPCSRAGFAGFIFVSVGGSVLALVADGVGRVVDISPAEMLAPPTIGRAHDCLRGLRLVGERFILVLDLERLLDAAECRRLAEVVRSSVWTAPSA